MQEAGVCESQREMNGEAPLTRSVTRAPGALDSSWTLGAWVRWALEWTPGGQCLALSLESHQGHHLRNGLAEAP